MGEIDKLQDYKVDDPSKQSRNIKRKYLQCLMKLKYVFLSLYPKRTDIKVTVAVNKVRRQNEYLRS